MKISGIYKIQSVIKSERIYIGSAVNIQKRWNAHLWHLRNNKHHTSKLQRHFNKYGESDLMFSILTICLIKELINTEQFYLDSHKTYFNTCKVAGSTLGIKASSETIAKLRITAKGNKGRKGISLTKEHKRKISTSMMGEKNPMYGKPSPMKGKKGHPSPTKGMKGIYSEETLAKMRISSQKAWVNRRLKIA